LYSKKVLEKDFDSEEKNWCS